jgi:hypothetical protein
MKQDFNTVHIRKLVEYFFVHSIILSVLRHRCCPNWNISMSCEQVTISDFNHTEHKHTHIQCLEACEVLVF